MGAAKILQLPCHGLRLCEGGRKVKSCLAVLRAELRLVLQGSETAVNRSAFCTSAYPCTALRRTAQARPRPLSPVRKRSQAPTRTPAQTRRRNLLWGLRIVDARHPP